MKEFLSKAEFLSLTTSEKTEYMKLDNAAKHNFTILLRESKTNEDDEQDTGTISKGNGIDVSKNIKTGSNEKQVSAENGTAATDKLNTVSEQNNGSGKPATGMESENGERRGRHKKDCDCDKCVLKRSQPPAGNTSTVPKGDDSADLKAKLSLYKTDNGATPAQPTPGAPGTQPPPPQPPKMDASKFITGALFLMVLDAAFPFLIITVFGMFNPRLRNIKQSSRKKLKLDPEEKKLLEESANEVVKYLFDGANPLVIFGLGVGFLYYDKVNSLEDEDFYTPQPKQQTNGRPKRR